MAAGKVAVITGGGTGIGRASALALAKDGYDVVVNYSRSAKEAEETANDISKLGVQGLAVLLDHLLAGDAVAVAQRRRICRTLPLYAGRAGSGCPGYGAGARRRL